MQMFSRAAGVTALTALSLVPRAALAHSGRESHGLAADFVHLASSPDHVLTALLLLVVAGTLLAKVRRPGEPGRTSTKTGRIA